MANLFIEVFICIWSLVLFSTKIIYTVLNDTGIFFSLSVAMRVRVKAMQLSYLEGALHA